MVTDSRQDSGILAAFEGHGGSPEPLTTTAVADTLDITEDRATARLESLADRGKVDDKQIGEARVWWPARDSAKGEAKREQRRRLDLFENIQDIANVGAWEYDIESGEGWGTDEVLRIHGLEPGDHISPEESIEFYHPEDRPRIRAAFERAVKKQKPYDLELRLITADGDQRWVRTRGQAQYEDGRAVRVHGTIQDVTDRKRREQETRRNRAFLSDIQEIANIGGWEVDLATERLQWTEEVYNIHGVERDYEPTIEDGIEFYHPDDRETIREAFEHLLSEGEPYDLELRIVRPDGEVRWVRTMGGTWIDESGETAGTRGVFQDITEQKKREQELEAEQQFVQQSLDALDDIFYVLDTDGTLRRWNEQVSGALGYTDSDLADANVVEFFPDDEHDAVFEGIETILSDGDATIEADLLTAAGERRPYEFKGTRLTDTDGNTTGIVGIGRDITERLERERELERKTRAIEEAPVGISITDPSQDDNPIIYVNQGFEEMTGYSREDILGQNCRFLQGEQTGAEHVAEIRQGIDDEEPVSVELRNYRKDGAEFWNHLEIAPVEDESGAVTNYVGFQQDVTDRKERERALEKRERILRELHAATREFYPPESETETAKFLVEFVEKAFGFEYVSVKQFEEDTGTLDPVARSTGIGETGAVGSVSPGSNPVWNAYRHGESQIVDGEQLTEDRSVLDVPVTQALVVPIGDFGVVLAYTTGDREFGHVDLELIEVVAANADATFQRLRSDRVRNELVDQLGVQQTKVDELRSVIDVIQAIQQRLADSDSQDAIEAGVCEELADTEGIDFVWIGRPQGADADLSPTAWAGEGRGYLDSVDTKREDRSLPAQRAATDRATYCTGDVASLVVDEAWAKEALSAELRSVDSIPLVYDDVLYGVLTVYSRDEEAFGQMHERLFTDVASLLVNYSRLLGHRYSDSQGEYTELEFELGDGTYPLQRLAADTDSRIRFDTVAENDTAEMRALVTVLEGEPERVLEAASSISSVVDASWFGDREHDQLALTVEKPFLASVVGKHGGTLVESVSDTSGTRFRVELSKDTARRPLLDSLSSRYREIEPVAQRQTGSVRLPGTEGVADILTERQYEILNAAYHGGYYETPRRVTGADLAESFDISSPAIYNHLQAAHRTLLETVIQPHTGISDETDGLNR
jgi:PAS domain S-box-containing protein